jgi:hypothetical protein
MRYFVVEMLRLLTRGNLLDTWQARLAFERSAAKKLLAARKARMDAAAAAAAAEIAAKEHEQAVAYEERRVLPPAFSKPYSALGLAHEAAASRLGFTAAAWPRLPRNAVANKVRLVYHST